MTTNKQWLIHKFLIRQIPDLYCTNTTIEMIGAAEATQFIWHDDLSILQKH